MCLPKQQKEQQSLHHQQVGDQKESRLLKGQFKQVEPNRVDIVITPTRFQRVFGPD